MLLWIKMSGLKINFHKSEVYCVGMNDRRKADICQILTCNMGDLPMKYLGLPINKTRITRKDWNSCENKMENRLGCWKGKLIDIGGRLLLLNSCLSSIPFYMLSFYPLPKGVRKRLDYFRARLLWQEDAGSRKYHLEKWPVICTPKNMGGMGVLDLECMNIALLGKWLWKLETEDGIWQRMLKEKYGHKRVLVQIKSKVGDSQFWKALMRIKAIFLSFCVKKVGSGDRTLFWEDKWLGCFTLAEKFSQLYNVVLSKFVTVAAVFNSNWSVLKFRRDLIGDKLRAWRALKKLCVRTTLTDVDDSVVWSLSKKGVFSVKSFYNALKIRQMSLEKNVIWDLKVPLKVKVFLWLASRNKILTKDNLLKKGWKGGSKQCFFCGSDETVQHLFLECVVAKFIWRVISMCFNIGPFVTLEHMWHDWFGRLRRDSRHVVGVGLAAVIWSIWRCRNDICFRHIFPNDPLSLINVICYWISSWAILQKSVAKEKSLAVGVRLLEHLTSEIFSREHGWRLSSARLCG
ncbi:hypothetical protein GUJ93_ZPchr0010g7976 [Zizania palustris]|uniref:Reverse transcriptase zinc-binding domain-containing protein n=1 Tax=Zizania palustris TaxID=103762 RepID=A0A8J5WC55_ZIZPA|nr:hypothetical protein GUJ93_ZPchr0010g7976 [Zizania palustris]